MSDADRVELMMRFRRDLAVILDRPEDSLVFSEGWVFLDEPSGLPSTKHINKGGRPWGRRRP